MELQTKIAELEIIITTKLLIERTFDANKRIIREEFSYSELMGLVTQTINSLIFSAKLSELRAVIRKDQIFLVYRPLGRVLAEIGIIGEATSHEMLRRPKVIIFGKGGRSFGSKNLADLISDLTQRSATRKNRRQYEKHCNHNCN